MVFASVRLYSTQADFVSRFRRAGACFMATASAVFFFRVGRIRSATRLFGLP